MGDSVGVSGHHLSHTLKLVTKVLGDNGLDPEKIQSQAVQTFAASITTLSQHQLEENEFLELIQSHPMASPAWEHLKTLAQAA